MPAAAAATAAPLAPRIAANARARPARRAARGARRASACASPAPTSASARSSTGSRTAQADARPARRIGAHRRAARARAACAPSSSSRGPDRCAPRPSPPLGVAAYAVFLVATAARELRRRDAWRAAADGAASSRGAGHALARQRARARRGSRRAARSSIALDWRFASRAARSRARSRSTSTARARGLDAAVRGRARRSRGWEVRDVAAQRRSRRSLTAFAAAASRAGARGHARRRRRPRLAWDGREAARRRPRSNGATPRLALSEVRPLGTYRAEVARRGRPARKLTRHDARRAAAHHRPGHAHAARARHVLGRSARRGRPARRRSSRCSTSSARAGADGARALEWRRELMSDAAAIRPGVVARATRTCRRSTARSSRARRASPIRRERWDTPDGDFVDVDFVDGPRGHALGASLPRARGLVELALRAHAHGRTCSAAAGAAACSTSAAAAASPTACRAPTTRATRDEIDWVLRELRDARGRRAALRGRRLARRQRARQVAGRARRRGARAIVDARRRGLRAARPHGRGRRARTRLRARLRARTSSRTLKRNSLAKLERFPGLFDADARAPRAHAARVRQRRHRAAARLPRHRRLLDARELQAVPAAHPRADAPPQRARRSLPARGGAARATRGLAGGQARIPGAGRSCRLRVRPLPRQHRVASRAALLHFFEHITNDRHRTRDLQGLRHPRHRRQDAHRGRRRADRPRRSAPRRASARASTRFVVGRDGRLSGPEARRGARARAQRRRHGRDRHRRGRDADGLLRHAPPRAPAAA